MAKLGEICKFQSGGTPSKNNNAYFGGTIPWITTVSLNGSAIGAESAVDWITEKAIQESAAKIVPYNSIMVGTRVGVGKVAINSVPMSTSQDIISLIDIDESLWDKNYLCKFILSKNDYLNSQARGATIKGIKIDVLSQLELSYIDIEKQKEIAYSIDNIEHIISLRKKQLQKLDDLVKSRFVEMFGDVIHNSKNWDIKAFSEIAASRLGKMLDGKKQTGKYSFPYLANNNVQWFRFDLSKLSTMDFDEKDRIEFELKDGDLLVCEGGEIGRCAVWHNEMQPCYFQKAIHRVRCDETLVMPDYLSWWFKYQCEHDGFASIEGAKATIAHLPGAKLKTLKVVVPPIELQKQFTTFIKAIDINRLTMQQGLDKLEQMKQALMQKYFG